MMESTVTNFENLAGAGNVDTKVKSELTAAGIECRSLPNSLDLKGEVRTRIVGELAGWTFVRHWTYWAASGPGLPPPYCDHLHERFGRQCRVAGDCTSPSPAERYKGLAVNVYHVDTPDALKALSDLLIQITSGTAPTHGEQA